jgi:subtilisin family serine protease
VRSTITFRSNSANTASRNSELINIKVTHSGFNINWAYIFDGLEYAKSNKAHIINLSIGHHDNNGVQCPGNCSRCTEVQEFARANNIIIVAAAGNEGPYDTTLNCPAMAQDIVSVGMTNYNGTGVDSISSRSIPGFLKPNLLTSGYVDYNTMPDFGTSFATPVVTGVLAAALPTFGFNSTKLIAALYNACDQLPSIPPHHQGNGVLSLNSFVEAIKNETATVDSQGQN